MKHWIPSLAAATFLAVGPALFAGAPAALAETGTKAIETAEKPPVVGADVSTFTLDNGLEVVVIPDRRAPVVTHMIWYKVGAADEKPGVSGIAHFLEHLMFKGTKTHPTGEFSAKVAEIGGEENAFTSYDYTAYYQKVSRQNLELMMSYEADRMANLVLTDEVVLPERDVILEERASRIDNSPSARLGEAFDAVFYIQHPYGIPIIGWRHEMEKLSRDDAIAFYNRFYTPNNAVLVVAGDVTADEVKALAEKTYGKVARRADPGPRVRPTDPKPMAERFLTLRDPQVTQPSVRRAWPTPSYTTAKEGEAEALDVLSEVLGGGSTSRIYRSLVVDKKLAASAGSWYQGTALDDTRFSVYASPRPGVELDALTDEIDAIIRDVAENGITDEELARAKRTIVADAIYAQDSQATLARIFGAALATGGTVEGVQTWPARIDAVTAKEVRDAAKTYLRNDYAVTAHLLPAPVKTAGDAPKGGADAPAKKPEPKS